MKGITRLEAIVLIDALEEYPGGSSEDLSIEERAARDGLLKELTEFVSVSEGDYLLDMWTDGAARPTNPGPAGIGVVGKIDDTLVIEVSEYIGRTTNNVAEYKAATTALKRAFDFGAQRVRLHSDSKLVVEQYHGRWRCKDESLIPLLGRLRGLAERFKEVEILWVPREKNREADGLSVAGAYATRSCGACLHEWHSSFCLVPDDSTGTACGCPHGFKGGISA